MIIATASPAQATRRRGAANFQFAPLPRGARLWMERGVAESTSARGGTLSRASARAVLTAMELRQG